VGSLLESRAVRIQSILLLLVIGGLFWAGYYARTELGLEFSQESVASVVAGLGWRAWLIYLVMVIFRTFLGLPSMVVLLAGGVVFGSLLGALLGSTGIMISAVLWYWGARGTGRDFIEEWLGTRAEDFQRRAEAAGPFLVGISTAHPAGPLTPFHLGAGLAAVPFVSFLVAVVVGSPVRASTLAFFGSTLGDFGSPRFYVATVVVLAAGLLPLAHRGIRERIFGAFRPTPSPEESEESDSDDPPSDAPTPGDR
jgi:uncharacterized membrane protein YdjX (TVP38/TMEM64 family)